MMNNTGNQIGVKKKVSIMEPNYYHQKRSTKLVITKGLFGLLSAIPSVFLVIISLFVYVGHVLLGIFGFKQLLYNKFALEILALLCLVYLLIMHACGYFTYSEVKQSGAITSAGIMVLSAGAAFFNGLEFYTHTTIASACGLDNPALIIADDVIGLGLTALQVLFLINHREMVPKKNNILRGFCQIAMAYLCVYNLIMWIFSIGDEALAELAHIQEANSSSHDHSSPTSHEQLQSRAKRAASNDLPEGMPDRCVAAYGMSKVFKPYTLPLEIEFFVFALSLYLSLLERCRIKSPDDDDDEEIKKEKPIPVSKPDEDKAWEVFLDKWERIFKGQGLYCGWLVLISTIVLVICGLYNYYLLDSHEDIAWMNTQVYSAHMMLTFFSMIAICLAVWPLMSMRSISSKKAIPPFRRDRMLLTGTGLFLFFYKVLTMAAGVIGHSPIVVAESFFCILHGIIQIVFINYFLIFKRPAYVDQADEQPGRQALGFLRWLCAAHWLMNTFLLKNMKSKEVQDEVFGIETFAIISSVASPMVILFYFHSLMFTSELLGEVYCVEDCQELENPAGNTMMYRKHSIVPGMMPGPAGNTGPLMYRKHSIVNFSLNKDMFNIEEDEESTTSNASDTSNESSTEKSRV